MRYLLVVSIGPVQGFIAAARKTRDLWFGSSLLCDVARAVARDLERQGGQLIFPYPEAARDEKVPIANKILAIVDAADPGQVAGAARQAALGCLRTHQERVVRKLAELGARTAIDEDLFRRQVDHFLEFASAWVRFDDPSQYEDARATVERLLAARKALRDFGPADGRVGVPKSSLDPARESAIRLDPSHSRDPERVRRVRASLRIKPGEQLDGIALMKRLGEQKRFVSVARVAVDPFIRRIAGAPEMEELNRLAREMERGGCSAIELFPADEQSGLAQYAAFPHDTELFYGDAQREPDLSEAAKVKAKGFYELVRRVAHDLAIRELPPYLAIIQADGDHMGAAIGRMRDPTAHQELSKALARFAARAEEIVCQHHGALVYGGGDDVLAFLPLDTALACADELRKEFARRVGAAIGQDSVSLSVGVAIGHFGEHLQSLLAWARAAEAEAKKPRNALAVALHTRTGGETAVTVVHSWAEDPVSAYWRKWVEWHRQDAIPDSAAFELRQLAGELRAIVASSVGVDVDGLAIAEARRILARKRREHGARELAPEQVDAILHRLRSKAERSVQVAGQTGDRDLDGTSSRRQLAVLERLEQIVGELVIARRLAVVADVAEGPIKR